MRSALGWVDSESAARWDTVAVSSVSASPVRRSRVEGPAAIEIQHLAGVICERVNRFLGWRAVERVALRQAPLRRPSRTPAKRADAAAAARIAEGLSDVVDDDLKQALARLGAAVRRS